MLTDETVEEPVRRQVAHSLMQLQSQPGNTGGSISALLTSLPPDQRNALAALASHAA